MKVNINSNFSLGMALPKYIEEKLNSEILKYFNTEINANVFFNKSGDKYKINLVINDESKRGITIKSGAESEDIYHAFDLSLTKTTKQIRKNKDKMLNYRKKISNLKAQNSDIPYIMAERFILKEKFVADKTNDLNEDNNDKQLYSFTVLEKKETEIEELSIDEALMKMDLINLPAYMFINKDNKLPNVVYKRTDGNITWINPKNIDSK